MWQQSAVNQKHYNLNFIFVRLMKKNQEIIDHPLLAMLLADIF